MAADQVLSINVVLPNGRFVTADSTSYSDLFWALCGGGGSTFGVVVSVTVKAYPDLPCAAASFSFISSPGDMARISQGDKSNNDFWAVQKVFLGGLARQADAGIYSYWLISPIAAVPGSMIFVMTAIFAPNMTAVELANSMKPITDKATEVGISLDVAPKSYPGFYPAWDVSFPPSSEPIGGYNTFSGSRLFPRENFENAGLWEKTFGVLRSEISRSNALVVGLSLSARLRSGNRDNAIHPAWRKAVAHLMLGSSYDPLLRNQTEIKNIHDKLTNEYLQSWRDMTPGSGSYLNEADVNEPNFQSAFWGSKYPELYRIKQKYDPDGVFYAATAVGSEDWATASQYERLGRLCRINAGN